MENSILDFREQKIPGNSREIPGKSQENFIPIYGNGNANGKFHSHFRERECEWQIPFPTFGTGIGGRYSREFPGSGIPAHGCGELFYYQKALLLKPQDTQVCWISYL